MSCKEVVEEELQVLEAIYADDFKKLSETSFSVNLSEVGLKLTFDLPAEYPQVIPKVSIDTTIRLDTIVLTKSVLSEAEKMVNIGEPFLFSLITFVSDNVDTFKLAAPRLDSKSQDDEQDTETPQYTTIETRQIEEGTPITRESFLQWHAKFIKECDPEAFSSVSKTRITGRQLFEQKIISVTDDTLEDDEDTFDMSNVNAALFVDLNDIESEDED